MLSRFYRCIFVLAFITFSYAQDTNSKKNIQIPKHYFKNIILFDYYGMPEVKLSTPDPIAQKIGSYRIQQSILAFNIPLLTKEYQNSDSTVSNFNILFTGVFLRFKPEFSGLEREHILTKNGLGIRMIYNNGKKSILFAEFAPFITRDLGYSYTRITRMASTLLWSYNPKEKFSFRIGLVKSFLWGNRYYLPFLGFRIGRTDKIYFSFQFPRQMLLSFPLGSKSRISWFTKPQGGFYSFSNIDTIYPAYIDRNKTIYLGRYEFISGVRFEFAPAEWLSLYLSAGHSINNYLAFYSHTFNLRNRFDFSPFFENKPQRMPFYNFGLVLQFGKTKSYFQRNIIKEQIQLNGDIGPIDENLIINTINQHSKKLKTNNEELSDLINAFDF
ncbi:MAG: hypothetical protein N3F09_03990 [Bacteroidia bacterium]|nr:hypothetical protein [Bacteroidia bacterium]